VRASVVCRRAWIAAAVASWGLGPGGGAHAAEASPTLDYLLIRGNEGGSAGGHAAIRFGEDTYHFEHADGLLRIGREDSQRFQYVYRTLQNRDIELTRVAVSADTLARLQDAFERRTLVQERQLAIAQELRADRALLSALRDASGRGAQIQVRGAGFFAPAPDPARGEDADAIAVLRARIESVHGEDFLVRRSRELERELAALAPQVAAVDAIELAPDRYPVLAPAYSRRVESLLAARFALTLLSRPRPLAPGALVAAADELALTDAERTRLREASDALRESLVLLVASRREDWGPPLLLGLARLAALATSLRDDRLALLDPFPAETPRLAVTASQRELLPPLLGEAGSELAAARRTLLERAGFPEQEWNALEAAAARWLELRAVAAGAPEIRIHAGVMVPEAARALAAPTPASGDLAALAARARAADERYQARLAALSGYDLLRHNCVSEIFRTLDAALAGDAGAAPSGAPASHEDGPAARDASTRELGGWVDPVAGLNFIPFVSSLRVRDRWRVAETLRLPSYRRHRLAQMARSESPLLVALRESNVLTARAHRPAEPESFFVFFSDAHAPLRPLFGAVNVGAAVVRSAFGLLELPFDRGRGLRAGIEGVLFSLPELAFVNLRKGYNAWIPPEERPPPG